MSFKSGSKKRALNNALRAPSQIQSRSLIHSKRRFWLFLRTPWNPVLHKLEYDDGNNEKEDCRECDRSGSRTMRSTTFATRKTNARCASARRQVRSAKIQATTETADATSAARQHSSASTASGKAFSKFLQLRQTCRHRCKLRLCVLLLPRIGRQFACMDALLLNAELVLRDDAVELIDKQFISPGHVGCPPAGGRSGNA